MSIVEGATFQFAYIVIYLYKLNVLLIIEVLRTHIQSRFRISFSSDACPAQTRYTLL